jgi:hypothetical protein
MCFRLLVIINVGSLYDRDLDHETSLVFIKTLYIDVIFNVLQIFQVN